MKAMERAGRLVPMVTGFLDENGTR